MNDPSAREVAPNVLHLSQHDPHARFFIFSRKHFLNWFLLSFLAGTINVGGYMACHRFVSHVTGFATLFGSEAARGLWIEAFGMLSVPLFFLLGTMVSAFSVERRISLGLNPRYGRVMSIATACLVIVAFGGIKGWFGPFGQPSDVSKDYLLLAMLCMASGLQNAVVTSVSGAIVRTTHLTGITTDLGIGLVRVLFPNPGVISRQREITFNKLRFGKICSFIAGSGVGAVIFAAFGYYGFFLPVVLALYTRMVARFVWEDPEFIRTNLLKSDAIVV